MKLGEKVYGFGNGMCKLSVSLGAWEKLRVKAGVSSIPSTGSNTPEVVASVGSQDEMKFFPCTPSMSLEGGFS